MTSVALLQPPPSTARRVRSLVVLGDSTAVGIGDRVTGNRWRGFARFVGEAMGVADGAGYANVAAPGARVRDVRTTQLPRALERSPDVALVVAGMNDTLRADFDAVQIAADLVAVADALDRAGCALVTVRYHDHTQVFRLPGPLRRALQQRIDALNGAVDEMARRPNVTCVDLARLYASDVDLWSVDRLHPSEFGHRQLARAITQLLDGAGFVVVAPVSVRCAGGVERSAFGRALWMLAEGVPWAARRAKDLGPYAAVVVARSVWSRIDTVTTTP